ncbi:MAG: serine/threonine protein kinase [Proteobacteria bacterium]|nr:serine/threonine protein kinase [Pseudomonadota bacterium]
MRACPTCGQKYLGNEEFCPQDGSSLVNLEETEDNDSLIGTTIDNRYRIDKRIGEGGMGVVYLATHAVIGKKCAVKVLSVQSTGEMELAERFVQEARAAAAIGNDHIIEITDFGQLPDSTAYFVMELLDGQSLQQAVERTERIGVERSLHILIQCCEALSAAHNVNIIHRDLKPDNVFLIKKGADSDYVKVLDFGIAMVARESGRLTRTGMIVGTPQYMSPEQAAGTNMDARTDIYSLGIIMYEMLTGHVPFEADTFMGVLTKHLYEEPIPPRRLVPPVDVPKVLESVLLKTIAKKPEKRYQSMADLKQDLLAVKEGETPAIVYDQMRESSYSTIPPSPAEIVSGARKTVAAIDDEIPIQRSRMPIFAGIAAVVVIGIIAGVFLFSRGDRNNAGNPADNGPIIKTAPATIQERSTADREPASIEKTAPVAVTVTSKPKHANIYKNGSLIGTLPLDLNRPRNGSPDAQYQLKLAGYESQDIILTQHTPATFAVTLKKLVKAPAEKSKSTRSSSKRKKRKKRKRTRSAGGDLADPWAQ